MVHDTSGMHHAHVRKRIHQKHEPYPHPDKFKRIMDNLIYVVAIFGPIMTLPQIIKIYVEKDASGVSAITWSAYLVTGTFWLIYGILHKDKPIILSNILWIILEIFIVLGIFLYG